jgi:hypothetical protein
MSDDSGVTVVTTLVWFYFFHARLRAHRAPGIPCALSFKGSTKNKTRAKLRREKAEVCFAVIPGRAKHRTRNLVLAHHAGMTVVVAV